MREFAFSPSSLLGVIVLSSLCSSALASNIALNIHKDVAYASEAISWKPYAKLDESVRKVYKEEITDSIHEDQWAAGTELGEIHNAPGMVGSNGELDFNHGAEAADIPAHTDIQGWAGKFNKDELDLIIPNATKGFVFVPESRLHTREYIKKEIIPGTEEMVHFANGDFKRFDVARHSEKRHILEGAGINNATRIDINGVHFRDINYITPTGLNAGSQKVVNVADGLIAHGSKDAINGGQLYDALKNMNVDWNRINRMGAMAAALAGLHPMEYDERHRFSVSAAYGNYRNGHGLAAGLYYRHDHRSMVSAGLAVSPGGDKMLNLGASYRLGAQKNEYASTFKDFASSEVAHQITINLRHVKEDLDEHKADVKAQFVAQRALDDKQTRRLQAQAREIRELKKENAALKATLKALDERLAKLEAKPAP